MRSRDKIFLFLSSAFVSCLIIANLLGITKFWTFFGLMVPIGIISYPLTFLVTDIVSELYGKKAANYLVFSGFLMNILMLIISSIAYYAPADLIWYDSVKAGSDPDAVDTFNRVYLLLTRGTIASMIAYLSAQFIDVYIFHWLKEKTKGKHLWLRNNVSTMTSQLVDSSAVILVTFYGILDLNTIMLYIVNSYIFKLIFALLDTPFIYWSVNYLKPKVER